MLLTLQRRVHEAVTDAARRTYNLAEVPAFSVEVPPARELGDLGVTVAFQLARAVRKPPRAIAQDLAGALGSIPGVVRVAATTNGYLNLYLDRPGFLIGRLGDQAAAPCAAGEKTIVEHTAINPNKAAHIGHLRNAVLGDTLARVLRFCGTPIEIQNYIDDLGVQVADIVVAFRELEHQTLEGVRHIAATTRFDYYCWDLYARATEWYEADRTRLAARAAALHDLECGIGDTAAIGALVVDRIVRAHLATMSRLNIEYDLLTYEGDILRLSFWAQAFEILKASGAVFLQQEGRLAGCWVMRIGEGGPETAADEGAAAGVDDEEGREKVIVRSNGVVTYVGKDIANQLWKFGLLGRDFQYRLFLTQGSGRPLWATTSSDGDPHAPAFGRAARTYNVIDSRQMYLQALLKQALEALGHPEQARHSIHFSYEMVALSHQTARELGYQAASDADDTKKPFVEVSGRKGLGVRIDDLLDLLTTKASKEVSSRNPDFTDQERDRAAKQIAIAAIRYFMLKYSRGKLIVFDMEEALSFEGETGPYLQYAVVRANNIFLKLREREGLTESDVVRALAATPPDELAGEGPGRQESEASRDLWTLVFEASRLDEIVDQVVRTLEFSVLAKYAFGLAQLFNAYYHRYPVLAEERIDRKRWRAAGVAYFRAQLARALDLMGVEVPSRM
jgi:arginyl-tRNA synthetase